MPTTEHRLTAKGKRLYHIFRNVAGEEVTPAVFIEDELGRAYNVVDECRSCGKIKGLCAGGFCVACIAGSVEAQQ